MSDTPAFERIRRDLGPHLEYIDRCPRRRAPAAEGRWLERYAQQLSQARCFMRGSKPPVLRFGRWLFARAVCRRAPYFRIYSPVLSRALARAYAASECVSVAVSRITSVRFMRLRWATCASLLPGWLPKLPFPAGMRWIPRGMTIEYLRKAETRVTATARLNKMEWAHRT